MTKKTFEKKNKRRIELLDRDAVYGLSYDEMEEFLQTSRDCTEYIDKHYPQTWEELEKLEADLALAVGQVNIIKNKIQNLRYFIFP